MARLMRASDGGADYGWGNASSRDAGRRTWAATAWLLAGTLVVAVTSYSLSLKVANERREAERMARVNVSLASDLKAMDAELRVRMRMPQLQRWNDTVLGMVPISATQYLSNSVQLADYGKPPEMAQQPSVQLAVRDMAPAAPRAVAPLLVKAELPPAPVPERAAVAVQRVSMPVAAAPVQAAPAGIARPVAAAPDDLMKQVEMTFGSADGANH